MIFNGLSDTHEGHCFNLAFTLRPHAFMGSSYSSVGDTLLGEQVTSGFQEADKEGLLTDDQRSQRWHGGLPIGCHPSMKWGFRLGC